MLKTLSDGLANGVIVAKSAVLRGKSKLDRDRKVRTYLIWNNVVAAISNSARRFHTNDVWLGEGAWSQRNQYPNGSEDASRTPHINYLKIPVGRC
jgi:hypothetical protein